jgi:hypothetical protein
MDIGDQQRVIIVDDELKPADQPDQGTEPAVEVELVGDWPLPMAIEPQPAVAPR